MSRPSWDIYFTRLAVLAATRATCDRRHVGAVLARDNRVLATGYNGSIRGEPHCDDAGHVMAGGHCVRTVHAEVNALLAAARHGVSVADATAYVTCYPCWACFKMLANAGILRVVYENSYRCDPLVAEAASRMGMALEQVEMDAPVVPVFCKRCRTEDSGTELLVCPGCRDVFCAACRPGARHDCPAVTVPQAPSESA